MFNKSDNHNPNYLASIVKIENFRPHSNADKLKVVSLFGNNVITGINAESGLYCYFPLECAISKEFLSYTNSFRDKELNHDKEQKGMFEENSRVKAIKLRGEKSEGYIVPVSILEAFSKDFLGKEIQISEKFVGTDFDLFGEHTLLKKYIPKGMRNGGEGAKKKTRGNVKKYASRLVENQFNFHPSTEQLKRNIDKINPDDFIVITEKYHGTSFVVSNVIVKKKLSLFDKIGQFFKMNIIDTEYGMLYSSRSVLKNIAMDDGKENNHFYDSDVWKIVADKLYPHLKKGYSAYGEIVGYTPSGSFIQRDYDYGCPPGSLDYLVYRMTYTNADGDVFELSPSQMTEYCSRYGLKTPLLHYSGKAKDLYPELSTEEHWHENFLTNLIGDYLEKKCKLCQKDVWAEGIVLRKDVPNSWEVYKLKSFNFLSAESIQLDSGEVDMETSESLEESAT
jgi:tRNA-binding EMAP/Myf-like protein